MCDDIPKKPLQKTSWGGEVVSNRSHEPQTRRILVQFFTKSSKMAMKKSSETPIDVYSSSKVKDVTQKVVLGPLLASPKTAKFYRFSSFSHR
mgnify:CR=1 FL=1